MKNNDVNEIIYVEKDRTKSRSKNKLNLISKDEYNNMKKKKKKDQQNHTRHCFESRILLWIDMWLASWFASEENFL